MADPKDFLVDWTERLLRHRDLLARKIKSIDKNKDGFDIVAVGQPKDRHIFVDPFMSRLEELSNMLDKDVKVTLVVYNTKDNLATLTDSWKLLNSYPLFCVMFVNPFSTQDTKWTVCPYTHDKVTEKASFSTGLKSMFDSVDAMDEIERNINRQENH